MSTRMTFSPSFAAKAARFRAVVVLPDPPLPDLGPATWPALVWPDGLRWTSGRLLRHQPHLLLPSFSIPCRTAPPVRSRATLVTQPLGNGTAKWHPGTQARQKWRTLHIWLPEPGS